MRCNGALISHRIEGFNPAAGRPVAILHSAGRLLDPCALNRARPDPIFLGHWAFLADSLPPDFSHTLTRVPIAPYFPAQRRNNFGGWRWLCPLCNHLVKTLYLPCGDHDFSQYLRDTGRLDLPIPTTGPLAVPEPRQIFACKDCHHILFFTRTHPSDTWNKIVLHLSGGLLFGREVTPPDSFTYNRQKEFRRRPLRNPTFRAKLLHLLLTTDQTRAQLARHLHVTWMTVHKNALDIAARANLPAKDFPSARASLRRHHNTQPPSLIIKQAG